MLSIRLQRTGRRNDPTYRLVVAPKTASAKRKFLEILGTYLPARNPPIFTHRDERITHWVKYGARPSNTVARLLKHSGMQGMEGFIEPYAKRKPRTAETQESAPNTPPTAPAAETGDTAAAAD